MMEWDEIQASWGQFVEDARSAVGREPDIAVGRVHRFYAGAMGSVELRCGKSSATIEWLEEFCCRDQLTPQIGKGISAVRRQEALRVADDEILMGTMARFYVDEDA